MKKFDRIVKEMFEFQKTPLLHYVIARDWKSVKRKLRRNFYLYIRNPVRNFYWAIRHRTINRYHVVKPPLKPVYYDTDHLIEASVFYLFRRFIEIERGGLSAVEKSIEYNRTEFQSTSPDMDDWQRCSHLEQSKELEDMRQIYVYLTQERDKIEEQDPYGLKGIAHDRDTEMLCRIIKLRCAMWT